LIWKIREEINDTNEKAAKLNILYPLPNLHKDIMSIKKLCRCPELSLEYPGVGQVCWPREVNPGRHFIGKPGMSSLCSLRAEQCSFGVLPVAREVWF
jgi:hypothetical protein